MNIFIINLSSAVERRKFQEEQLSRLRLKYEVLKAISVDDIGDTSYRKHYYDWQRPLRNVEVACYYSHKSAWQKIIDNNKPSLILEDDALLSQYSGELLNALDKFTAADYVQLEVHGRKKLISKKELVITPKHTLHRLYLDRTGAAGYVLWPSGAIKLLRHEKKHGIGLADAHITSCSSLIGYQIEPAIIIQLDQCNYYKLKQPIKTDSYILSKTKPTYNKSMIFKFKRIAAQLKMAFIYIRYCLIANRKEIILNPCDFLNK